MNGIFFFQLQSRAATPAGNEKSCAERYKFGFNGQEKVNEIAGVGNHNTALFWEYDTRLGRRWNLDPVVNPSVSLYSVMEGNPIWKNDVLGNVPNPSTHTDKNGNVVQVRDDRNLGVYRHDDLSKWNGWSNLPMEGKGVTKMGETWTPLGFADFDEYEATGRVWAARNAKIDFASNWATFKIQGLLNDNPTLITYGLKAGGSEKYDFKTKVPAGQSSQYGSILFGKFASARDVGNIGAGLVAQRSIIPNGVSDYGFGKYNQMGNNKVRTFGAIMKDLYDLSFPALGGSTMKGIQSISNTVVNGEDKLSKQGIETGKKLLQHLGY